MSFYVTLEGSLVYEKQADFDRAIEALKPWLNEKNIFVGEDDEPITEESTIDEKTIYIPYYHYRNITRVFNSLIPGNKGWMVWTSTDGCFEGGAIREEVETTYDLNEWGKENIEEEAPDTEDHENWCEWANEVEQCFNEEFNGVI